VAPWFELNAEEHVYEILIWHAIVNDIVGDVPVAITLCPPCNTAEARQARAVGCCEYDGWTTHLALLKDLSSARGQNTSAPPRKGRLSPMLQTLTLAAPGLRLGVLPVLALV